ncbi:hypothetical protein Tco_0089216 [Tanacetum coccineum]
MTPWRSSSLPLAVARGTRSNGQDLKNRSGYEWRVEMRGGRSKFDHIPPEEKPMAFLLAEDKFLKIKQAIEEEQNQPDDIQELMHKLLNDLKICDEILLKQEEQAV